MTIKILNSIYNVQQNIDTVEFDTGDGIKRTAIGLNSEKLGNFDEQIISAINAVSDFTNTAYYYENGSIIQLPNKPSNWVIWNWETHSWVDPRPLTEVKAAKWLFIRDQRNQVEYGGLLWDGKTFDSDPTSQQRIMGAVQLAALNPDLIVDWTLKDNSVIELSSSDLQNLGIALAEHVNQVHKHARELRSQIDSASTNAEVDAIVW